MSAEATYQNNPTAPDVNFPTSVQGVANDQFRSSVARATTTCLHEITLPHSTRLQLVQAHALHKFPVAQVVFLLFRQLLDRIERVGEAEVGNDDVAIAVQKQIFKLQVSVHDALLV